MKPIVIIAIAFVLLMIPTNVYANSCTIAKSNLNNYELISDSCYRNNSGFGSVYSPQECIANAGFTSEEILGMKTEVRLCNLEGNTKATNQQTSNVGGSSDIICGKGTVEKNGQCVPAQKLQTKPSLGGGCLIATATYGSELAPQVQQLRELRDNSLLSTESGTNFINSFNDVYYSFSPYIADYERENPLFKEMVKLFITPMITSLSILNYVEMDSESKVLGYGISLIVLNTLMYVGVPVLAVMRFRK